MAYTTFLYLNVHSFSKFNNLNTGNTDILMSGLPLTFDKQVSINNIRLKETEQILNYHTTPIYCNYISCDRYLNISINTRTLDLEEEKLIENINLFRDIF